MSTTRIEWTPEGHVSTHGATDGRLHIYPGLISGDQIAIVPSPDLAPDDMLLVADHVLAGVQQWRDTVAEYAARQRTTADELAAAKAEIARLRAKAEGEVA